jgi:hypothetical protein
MHWRWDVKQLTVRNVDGAMAKALAAEARRRRKSLNQTVLEVLAQGLGLGPDGGLDNGLGKLAGTWSEEDQREFEAATAQFEEIDEELWR